MRSRVTRSDPPPRRNVRTRACKLRRHADGQALRHDRQAGPAEARDQLARTFTEQQRQSAHQAIAL
jgi:hypothetical protein